MIARRDGLLLGGLFSMVALLLLEGLAPGRHFFVGDLTMYDFPWHVFETSTLQEGSMPLWNPFLSFGMPLLANMQIGTLYPPNTLFKIIPFGDALDLDILLHYFLCAFWTFLWLRHWGASRAGATTGAAIFALGGYTFAWLTSAPTLIAAVSWIPSFFVFSRAPILFSLASAMCLLAGYPLLWGFGLFAFASLELLWRGLDIGKFLKLGAALAGSLLLSAALFVPGSEFIGLSKRGTEGTDGESLKRNVLTVPELMTYANPELYRQWAKRTSKPLPPTVRTLRIEHEGETRVFRRQVDFMDPVEDPEGRKYRPVQVYVGTAALLAMLFGFGRGLLVKPWLGGLSLAWTAFWVLIIMGRFEGLGIAYWVRNPKYLAVLALLGALPILTVALRNRKWGPVLLLLTAAELLWLGWGFHPTAPRSFYEDRGSLVEALQPGAEEGRYYQTRHRELFMWPSNVPAEARDIVYLANKRKLFGLQNTAYRIPAVESLQPLVPASSSRIVRELRRSKDLDQKLALLRWTGAARLVSPGRFDHPALGHETNALLEVHRLRDPAPRAFWIKRFPESPLSPPENVAPLRYELLSSERSRVTGVVPDSGWIFVSDLDYPGWRARLAESGAVPRDAAIESAFETWRTIRVERAGPVQVDFRYAPGSFLFGTLINVASLLFLFFWGIREWNNRRDRVSRNTADGTPRPAKTSTPA